MSLEEALAHGDELAQSNQLDSLASDSEMSLDSEDIKPSTRSSRPSRARRTSAAPGEPRSAKEERARRRQEQNKASARAFRQRRKLELETLQDRVNELEADCSAAHERIAEKDGLISTLQTTLANRITAYQSLEQRIQQLENENAAFASIGAQLLATLPSGDSKPEAPSLSANNVSPPAPEAVPPLQTRSYVSPDGLSPALSAESPPHAESPADPELLLDPSPSLKDAHQTYDPLSWLSSGGNSVYPLPSEVHFFAPDVAALDRDLQALSTADSKPSGFSLFLSSLWSKFFPTPQKSSDAERQKVLRAHVARLLSANAQRKKGVEV